MAAYFAERAAAVGMIITGGIAPNEGGMVFRDENGDAVFARQNYPPMPKLTGISS